MPPASRRLPTLQAHAVKAAARRHGFDACGLAPAAPVDAGRQAAVAEWLDAGCNGTMDYLRRHFELRADPRRVVPGALTVVSLALNYFPAAHPQAFDFAYYAYGRDYHDVLRTRLNALLAELAEQAGMPPGELGRGFCDTGPVDERYWAVRCGLGWQGRNAQLIIPGLGSYFFLAELLLTLPADAYDEPRSGGCGGCDACLAACPTGALDGRCGLDARRCLSYLTIEHRGSLPSGTGRQMGRCFYGCDRCQQVCPHNRHAAATRVPEFRPSPEFLAMTPEAWAALSPDDYRRLFRGSAVKRAKYEGLRRNVEAVIAAGGLAVPPPGDRPVGCSGQVGDCAKPPGDCARQVGDP